MSRWVCTSHRLASVLSYRQTPAPAAGQSHHGDDVTETRERSSRFHRLPPKTQAVASAALALPTLAFYAPIIKGEGFSGLAFAVSGVYFLAVLAVVARSRRRRWQALVIAAATLAVEISVFVLVLDDNSMNDIGYLATAAVCALPTGYVAAWGVARRQHPMWWKAGLPLAAVAVILPLRAAAFAALGSNHTLVQSWWMWWLIWPAAVVLGCVVCWAVDAWADRRASS